MPSKSHFINIIRRHLSLSSREIPRISLPEIGMKTNYTFLIISHNITCVLCLQILEWESWISFSHQGCLYCHQEPLGWLQPWKCLLYCNLHVLLLDESEPNMQESIVRVFPGGAMVESLPADAGDTGSSPGLGRSHMPRSNWAREPQLLSLRVRSLCSATRGHDGERPAHRDEEWPPLAATRESPRTETKTQHSHK